MGNEEYVRQAVADANRRSHMSHQSHRSHAPAHTHNRKSARADTFGSESRKLKKTKDAKTIYSHAQAEHEIVFQKPANPFVDCAGNNFHPVPLYVCSYSHAKLASQAWLWYSLVASRMRQFEEWMSATTGRVASES